MPVWRRFLALGLLAAWVAAWVVTPARAETLTVASWNVANLAEAAGTRLRGHVRGEEDYERIRALLAGLDADIVALQEIGSLKGARAILGDAYEVHFESRCYRREAACESDVGDIFNAIAYRRELEPHLRVFQIDSLAVMHESACEGVAPRQVRGGVGVKLDWNGRTYAVPSLHFKAGCRRNALHDEPDLVNECATLTAQFDNLAAWMAAPEQEGEVLVVAGDFNRELRSSADLMRGRLLSAAPDLCFEPSEGRECWMDAEIDTAAIARSAWPRFPEIAAGGGRVIPYTPRSNRYVDYFAVSGLAEGEFVSSEQHQMGAGQRLDPPDAYLESCEADVPKQFPGGGVLVFSPAHPSDHCPISLTIRAREGG